MYTEQQRDIRDTVRSYMEREAPLSVITELDSTGTYPAEILAGMADLGLWGIAIDERYGGSLTDETTRCLVIEEIQRAGACLGYAFVSTALFCAQAITEFGSRAQREEMLPEIASGKLRMAILLTEPDTGSDLMKLTARGRRDGERFVLNGQKTFATGADVAGNLLILVRTAPEESARSALTFFLVPAGSEGLSIRPLPKLAGQGTHTCEVFIDEVSVPESAVLGPVGGGAGIVMRLLNADRVYVGAQSLGIAQGAFDLARKYAVERRQFGKPIIEHQAIGHMLADMKIRLDSARYLVNAAAKLLDSDDDSTLEASMAKIAASEAATSCATDGMQILGGYSYMVEYGMERYYREAKIQEIFGGTNQILRNVMAKELAAIG